MAINPPKPCCCVFQPLEDQAFWLRLLCGPMRSAAWCQPASWLCVHHSPGMMGQDAGSWKYFTSGKTHNRQMGLVGSYFTSARVFWWQGCGFSGTDGLCLGLSFSSSQPALHVATFLPPVSSQCCVLLRDSLWGDSRDQRAIPGCEWRLCGCFISLVYQCSWLVWRKQTWIVRVNSPFGGLSVAPACCSSPLMGAQVSHPLCTRSAASMGGNVGML